MTLYAVLGVPKDATQQDIKAAYRKMAQKHHPDRPEGDEDQFRAVQHAYEVLSDEAKRARYDQDGFDGSGPDLRMLAIQQLAGLFMQMIAEEVAGDLIKNCLKAVEQTTEKLTKEVKRCQRDLEKLEKYRARVVNKSGRENIFLLVVDNQIAGIRAQIAGIDEKLSVVAVVSDILSEHEDAAPTEVKSPYAGYELAQVFRQAGFGQAPFGTSP